MCGGGGRTVSETQVLFWGGSSPPMLLVFDVNFSLVVKYAISALSYIYQ